jgi:polysaccharide biosynthesis/export protein
MAPSSGSGLFSSGAGVKNSLGKWHLKRISHPREGGSHRHSREGGRLVIPAKAGIQFSLCLSALTLQACTGLYLSLPNEDSGRDLDITVQPITPALVTQKAAAKSVPPSTIANATGLYLYKIGPGDILDISIPSIASVPVATTGPYPTTREQDRGYTVAPDGTIYLPYVGPIKVQGATIREVQDQVVKELSRFIKIPQVSVSVTQFRSQKVLVAGQVPKPGYLPVTDVPLTLVGALTLAGSTPQLRGDLIARAVSGQQTQQVQAESGDYRRVQVTRTGKVETYDVLALLKSGDLRQDPLLQDSDVVYVAPVERNYVYVLGQVKQPALLEIVERRTSLAEVLLASGGIDQLTAKAERVYVIRGNLDRPDVFQLNANEADALLLADAFVVQPRDVVYVAEANISRWNRFLSQLAPTLQTLITGGIFANTVGD